MESTRARQAEALGYVAAGYRAAAIDGETVEAERDQAIRALGTGQLDVLTSCDIVSEGTDIPVVVAAILLRPTMSTGLYMQQVGRVLVEGDDTRRRRSRRSPSSRARSCARTSSAPSGTSPRARRASRPRACIT